MQSFRQALHQQQQTGFNLLNYSSASRTNSKIISRNRISVRLQHHLANMSKAVVVTGATGNQGGALIQALVEANADLEIIAVSRDPSSQSAQRLAKRSPKIKVIAGDLDKADDIFTEARKATNVPIWGVYSVQTFSTNPWNQSETRHGKALVDAALKNDVEMFVYSSVDRGGDSSYDNPTIVPHFKTKHEIEHHLVSQSEGTKMSYTILRPVAFMNNFIPGFIAKAFSTMWDMRVGNKPLQLIAASDIGYFAAQAFMNPSEYKNRGISLAGDELTIEQVAEVFKAKTGEALPTTNRLVASGLLLLSRDMSLMLKWMEQTGFGADIEQLRKIHPRMKTFGDWLVQESAFVKRS